MRRHARPRAFTFGVVAASLVAVGTGSAGASGSQSGFPFTVGRVVAGRTYAQWEAAEWQWSIEHVSVASGARPSKERCVAGGLSRSVSFVGATTAYTSGGGSTESCTVPRGRYVMLELPNIDCSTVEAAPFHATTAAGLEACARREWLAVAAYARVTIDGRSLIDPAVTTTAAFAFHTRQKNNELGLAPPVDGGAAVTGFVAFLRPLSVGVHILRVDRRYSGPVERVTYRLTAR